jgi:hypothetical protein
MAACFISTSMVEAYLARRFRHSVRTDDHGLPVPCRRPHGAHYLALGAAEKIFLYGDAPRWLANFLTHGLPVLRTTRLFKSAYLGIEPLGKSGPCRRSSGG